MRFSRYLSVTFKLFLISATFLFVGQAASKKSLAVGTQYYIDSVSGSDANNGLSPQSAWKTISKVQGEEHAGRFVPGDVISFKAGTSYVGSLEIQHSGTSSSPIKITSYGSGSNPVFTSPAPGNVDQKVFALVGNYLIIENLTIKGNKVPPSGNNGTVTDTTMGVFLYQTTGSVVRNLDISGVGFGINIDADNNLITNNHIHDNELIVNSNDNGFNDYGGIGILIMGDNNRISGNRLDNLKVPSYDFEIAGEAFQFFAGVDEEVSGNIIEKNISANNGGFLEISGRERSSFNNNNISYNLLKESRRLFTLNVVSGIDATVVRNLNYFNNTSIETTNPERYPYIVLTNTNVNSDIFTLKNNIFYLKNFLSVSQISNFEHKNNLYYLDNSSLGYTKDPTEIISNPFFNDFTNGDYSLNKASPAIDNGLNLGGTSDFNNNPVPKGNSTDIGAFESNYAQSPLPALYRFWSFEKKAHFYTKNVSERDSVLFNDQSWSYEAIAYYVGDYDGNTQTCSNPSMAKVHRFWSAGYKHHFYTKSEAEKNSLIANDPNWVYEGVAFCASEVQGSGQQPVYRFWSSLYRGHFYTMNAAEKDSLIANDPNWAFEGIAYYANEN